MEKKNIYLILTGTDTLLTKAIGIYTRKKLNHVSISFDKGLREVYSFGRKKESNPFIGGFVKENFRSNFFRKSMCEVYELKIDEFSYDKLKEYISYMELNKDNYKYNFIGLFCILLKFEIKRKNSFFCSEFVATLLKEIEIYKGLEKPCFVKPHDFVTYVNMDLIYVGHMNNYVDNVDNVDNIDSLDVRYGLLNETDIQYVKTLIF